MFHRKLAALDYLAYKKFSSDDEASFRNLIVWLEDQKIRHYKIEEREKLRKTSAGDWEQHVEQYLKDLSCPHPAKPRNAALDWLLGYAVRLEYGDNADKYKTVSSQQDSQSKDRTNNPLECMDFNSPDFKAGVASLAQLLQLPPYDDHQVLLKAVACLVSERLSKQAIANASSSSSKETKPDPDYLALDQTPLGFETSDYISAEAAKILRLLHIRELRQLQTSINEAIVRVQEITANPKTDARLGKVGMM